MTIYTRFSSLIRRYGFFALDMLRGGLVREHLQDLEQKLSVTFEPDVDAFLDYARSRVPYYRRFTYARRLSDFPVLKKSIVRECTQEFLNPQFDRERLIPSSTSGSYGTPMTFWFSKEKKARQRAEVIYFNRWGKCDLGDLHANIRAMNKSRLGLFLENQVLMNPTYMTQSWMEQQLAILRRRKVRIVIGYASTIAALARLSLAKGFTPRDYSIESVIYTSETMSDEAYHRVKDAFGCMILSRYATMEFGVLAHECPHSQAREHHVNCASYKLEVLHIDRDEPVNQGEIGRIVVTDLYSHAMPLIRYDTGDLGALRIGCSCGYSGPVLTKIEGRAVEEIRDTRGRRVSPFGITNVIWDLEDIIQLQIRQEGPRVYRVLIVPTERFSGEDLLRMKLYDVLGEDADLVVERVDDIPPLRSGKRPYIVNAIEPGFDSSN